MRNSESTPASEMEASSNFNTLKSLLDTRLQANLERLFHDSRITANQQHLFYSKLAEYRNIDERMALDILKEVVEPNDINLMLAKAVEHGLMEGERE